MVSLITFFIFFQKVLTVSKEKLTFAHANNKCVIYK